MFIRKALKKILPFILIVIFGIVFVRSLNPFDATVFSGHDETQAARIAEFAYNVREGIFPPRIAPHVSFHMGYPIFNFYAPTAYLITTTFHLLGLGIAQAIEASFALAVLVGGVGMYRYLSHLFGRTSGLVGAVAFISSPYVAVDIFVRMNLAEAWFFALLPLSLFLIHSYKTRYLFVTSLVLMALFTAHNLFSLVAIPFLLTYALLSNNKRAVFPILGGLLMSAYFWIPSLLELDQVHASQVATLTRYTDHFLCPVQLWSSAWGFGGSTGGCDFDGMSFMVGKIQILAGIFGFIVFVRNTLLREKTDHHWMVAFMALLLMGSVFMSLSFSRPVWMVFEPILSIFQFPWRFLLFVVFGLSFFVAYLLSKQYRLVRTLSGFFIIACLLFLNVKYFSPQKNIPIASFEAMYLSPDYISKTAAYKVPEYLPISADYQTWIGVPKNERFISKLATPLVLSGRGELEDISENSFKRRYRIQGSDQVKLNIHDALYWEMALDGKRVSPDHIDVLGRPTLTLPDAQSHEITISYRQTPIARYANIITVITGIILMGLSTSPTVWKKRHTI